jgi:acyl dehydratase
VTREIVFDSAPDLRRIFARALLRRGPGPADELPDVRAVRHGIRIDVDHLVDYARMCGFTVGSTLPVTYPHLFAFPLQIAVMSEPGFPLPLMGAVHTENVITALRPIRVDEVLDVSVRAENVRPHRRGRQVDLVSEVSAGGAPVWRGVSTYFSRGEENPGAARTEPPALGELSADPHATWRLGEGTGRAYAAVSGDWNPIHLHRLAAKPLGFPTAIAHGMYTYARVMATLTPRLPDSGLTSRVWFRKPLRLPSTVRLRSLVEDGRTLTVVEHVKGEIEHAVVENTW